ncbi:uncharacterized protein K489DRAFT_377033 [Dissoconium aciculare CBS 342.82]|uniref:Hypersensitive response-inducing protein n=1 Tax=Dissoconium aciculare CBS 342.82 TaxID=1314786 RepID=A0A6J3MFI5_9PEZI|nr:uncharacterized protein K489DRAFT_377033 [Dissoconium aciculare CBS 342.82]KAF1826603.1 hypothetical protein K489DRAFT_377033 [Dissoconium aciculare CBS 342.82]
MRASTIIALASSTLVAAAPTPRDTSSSSNIFEISDFVFGCTNDCGWSFKATITGSNPPTHPSLDTPVTCAGNFNVQDPSSGQQYVDCSATGDAKTSLVANIDPKTNVLSLLYLVSAPEDGNNYRYLGQKEVYAVTGPDADKQAADFSVPQTFEAATPIF